jgi:DNA-binding transcriptional MerR regulator
MKTHFKRLENKMFTFSEIEQALEKSDEYHNMIEDKLRSIISELQNERDDLKKQLEKEKDDVEFAIETFSEFMGTECKCKAAVESMSAWKYLYLPRH